MSFSALCEADDHAGRAATFSAACQKRLGAAIIELANAQRNSTAAKKSKPCAVMERSSRSLSAEDFEQKVGHQAKHPEPQAR